MKSPQIQVSFLVIIGAFNIAFCIPIEEKPHVNKRARRDSIEDYYSNDNLPLGYFINGADADDTADQKPSAALFAGSGFRDSGSGSKRRHARFAAGSGFGDSGSGSKRRHARFAAGSGFGDSGSGSKRRHARFAAGSGFGDAGSGSTKRHARSAVPGKPKV
ncbi:protein SPT2 homolog isoform X2 [Dendronephthya gigantea]|nr:protein SPT2 homolog isoform X2 [Dendronephthya gigantea]XP_028392104.1 protein SPT2 homolog isoform X2 [Dendronephthya gigantea]